jgi:adenylate kinase
MMNLILLGAPGAGKGTQAEILTDRLGIPAISTGNIIREALKNGTEMGLKAKSFIEAGQLVPDEVVIGIIRERLAKEDCQNGFILDGFPRTVPQAQALEDMGVSINKVIDFEVEDEEVMKRLGGRRVCEGCGASYHMLHKRPQVEGVCDRCGAKVVTRKDDAPETIRERLEVYHQQTEPLKAFYAGKGLLVEVAGETIEENTSLTLNALRAEA